jgi:hypothetical protein
LNGRPDMTPVGYMAKRVRACPDWLQAAHVTDIYSVSNCISEDFSDFIRYWKHNGYWLFDSPEVILSVARENSIDLAGTSLFYYEAYALEFDGENWRAYAPEPSIPTQVVPPFSKRLAGFDIVTFSVGTSPECSPLSCNSMAKELRTNAHCLFASFDEAETSIKKGAFRECEPGPLRIFSVYSVDWSVNWRVAHTSILMYAPD